MEVPSRSSLKVSVSHRGSFVPALVVGPMEVKGLKGGVRSRKATHGPRLFRSHPSVLSHFEYSRGGGL
jgi:hypothetical protein